MQALATRSVGSGVKMTATRVITDIITVTGVSSVTCIPSSSSPKNRPHPLHGGQSTIREIARRRADDAPGTPLQFHVELH